MYGASWFTQLKNKYYPQFVNYKRLKIGKTSVERALVRGMKWTLGVAQIDFLFALQLLLHKLICLMDGEVPFWESRQNILEPKYSLSTARGCMKWVNTAMNTAWFARIIFARIARIIFARMELFFNEHI